MAKKQDARATALYERLSRDDENQGESNSISNQKDYLESYAKRNGFDNIRHFTDDGYSGRNFNRPGFQALLQEIHDDKIGTVIVKDMSRFGRNYLEVGFYTEVLFPQKEVRFIAVNNSVDSEQEAANDFTPFINIMNEWYAKDTSNKIKAVFDARMNEGKRCSGSIPYGYNRLPEDKQTLVVDPVASKVVKRIFELASERKTYAEIARILEADNILIPSAYTAKYHPEQNNHRVFDDPYRWRPTVVKNILFRREYLGHTILKKSIPVNFKTGKRKKVEPEDMLVFENTHEPIIDQELWDKTHKLLDAKRRLKKPSEPYGTHINANKLCGFVFCADCGSRMTITAHKRKDGSRMYNFRCGAYATDQRKCSNHYINAESLEQLVLHTIRRVSSRVITDEEAFAESLRDQNALKRAEKPDREKKELREAKRRYDELDNLIRSLYENYVAKLLPERQYKSLMDQYDREQTELEQRIGELEAALEKNKQQPIRIDRFIEVIKKYKEPTELTDELLRELIDKIIVYQAEGKKKNRTQKIEIYFNFVGKFELAETAEEAAARIAEEKAAEEHKAEIKQRQYERNRLRQEQKKAERYAEREGHKFAKKVCIQCGKEFWPTHATQTLCSDECRKSRETELRKKRIRKPREKQPKESRVCIICGNSYLPNSSAQKTCSLDCRKIMINERQRQYYKDHVAPKDKEKRDEVREQRKVENEGHLYPKRICECCGKEYWPTKQHQRYCSHLCGKRGYRMEKKGLEPSDFDSEHIFAQRECVECGKLFWPNGATHKTCSEECRVSRINRQKREYRQAAKEKKPKPELEPRECAECGKVFVPDCAARIVCSEECFAARRKRKMKGYSNAQAERERLSNPMALIRPRECVECGKLFWPNASTHKTCSEECNASRRRRQQREYKRIERERKKESSLAAT